MTAVFDAIRSTPKQRYNPSAENVELSTLDFAAARSGSVLVAFHVPNNRLLVSKSDLDITFDYVSKILHSKEDVEFRELVTKVGVASLSKAYVWADASSTYGLDTVVQWGKTLGEPSELSIARSEALLLKDALEKTSDDNIDEFECYGILIGIDVVTTYFHLKTDDGTGIKGELSNSFSNTGQWTTSIPYKARIRKAVRVKYSTGEEKPRWPLLSLEEQTDPSS